MLGRPLCFPDRQTFESWKELAEETGRDPKDYCWDCTLAAQRVYKRLGECMHPETQFVPFLEDGEIVFHGVRGEM